MKVSSSGMVKKTNGKSKSSFVTESFFATSFVLMILPPTIDSFSIGTIIFFNSGFGKDLSNEMALMLESEKDIPIWLGAKNFGNGKCLERNSNFMPKIIPYTKFLAPNHIGISF